MSDMKIEKDKWYKCNFYIKGISGESNIGNDFMLKMVKFAIDNMNGVDELKITQCSITLEDRL